MPRKFQVTSNPLKLKHFSLPVLFTLRYVTRSFEKKNPNKYKIYKTFKPKLEAVLTGFNSFRFFLFSGLNFVTGFFTTTFLPEPKLNPGVFEVPRTGVDRPGVVPGRDRDCVESSSEETAELLDCGLGSSLGRLFCDPFVLSIDELILFILAGFFSPCEGIHVFLTSSKTFLSCTGSVFKLDDGSKTEISEKINSF